MLLRSAKLVQVGWYAVLNGSESHIATALAKLRQVRLRIALVRAFEMIGERDVTNLALAVPLDDGFGDIIEALCAARSGVVNTGDARVIEEPQVDVTDVFDIDEVAQLLPVTVAVGSGEQARLAVIEYLVVEMESDARHRAFVLLPWPVHIEVPQPDNLAVRFRRNAPHVAVELQFGIAVNVERISKTGSSTNSFEPP